MQDSLCAGDSADASTYTGLTQNEESRDPMPTLADQMKAFIVKGLACFDTPSAVAEAIKLTSGVELSRRPRA